MLKRKLPCAAVAAVVVFCLAATAVSSTEGADEAKRAKSINGHRQATVKNNRALSVSDDRGRGEGADGSVSVCILDYLMLLFLFCFVRGTIDET